MSAEPSRIAVEKIQPYCSQCGAPLAKDYNVVDYHPFHDVRTVICICGSAQMARFSRPVIDQKELA